MTDFVKTETKRTIQTVVDGKLGNGSLMSTHNSGRYLSLVIGARKEHSCASTFSKASLASLIGILKEIHEAMEG